MSRTPLLTKCGLICQAPDRDLRICPFKAASTCSKPRSRTAIAAQAEHNAEIDRRSFLAAASAFSLAYRPNTVLAQETSGGLQQYKDERDNFTIAVPAGWSLSEDGRVEGSGPTARKRTLAWFEEGNPSSYATVVITNTGADYTKLGSFGTAEQFGLNLVASMDRSFLKRAPQWARSKDFPQEAKLLKTKEKADTYFIEYTILRDAGDLRHLLSSVALGYNGRYSRLYTLTAQCTEEQYDKEKDSLLAIIDSFQAPYART